MPRAKTVRGRVSLEITPQREAIGRAFTKARRLARLTQQQVADALGTTQAYVSQWESGAREIPASALLDLKGLGIQAAEIFIQAELETRE